MPDLQICKEKISIFRKYDMTRVNVNVNDTGCFLLNLVNI